MYVITSQATATRDQSQFCLGGGHMKKNSNGSPLQCSVSSININTLGTDGYNNSDNSKINIFQWPNIQRRYKRRPKELYNINLYKYCALHWSESQQRPVQFYGFNQRPTWPLDEKYCKWMLTIFKNWENNVDELKAEDGTFKSTLKTFMYSSEFPK